MGTVCAACGVCVCSLVSCMRTPNLSSHRRHPVHSLHASHCHREHLVWLYGGCVYMCSGSVVVWGVLCVVGHVWGVCTGA